ncbi:MAG: GNAT family N-acetyltransferase [Clostridia bacterium]|nr:GNAT family N-acetyltransferase [Clostridia bacterium]
MTNQYIWETALRQSAYDFGCDAADFTSNKNKVVLSQKSELARKYLPLPFECDMVTYGAGIVAQTSERAQKAVREYIEKYPSAHAFETPNIHALDERLAPFGLKVCFMAEYFLPDIEKTERLSCAYELRVLKKEDFSSLYLSEWSNALCEKRKELDMLAVGAYDEEKLIGLAGASADCEEMYQIGVDVLPEYRKRGVAAAITSNLAAEIILLGKVPFYCAAWCNMASVRNAIKCGFRPAWAELTARDIEFINEMNK